ncbi:MAG TPA: Ig-like domain-containing protein [Candidatus Edwardsbacteria bacterium]|nr:Ig-like domain-containing protein [Candidatus Edwardsbacteria bacterium]
MFRRAPFIIILLQAAALSATVINVPADRATIQAGIDNAASGDTVLVARGTYYENINFRGRGITVASRFLLTGDVADIDSTVINGGAPVHPDTASCALFISGEDSSAVLCGFTLTAGGGTRWPDEHGAGTYREGGGVLVALCSPTIRNNRIVDNHTVGGDGLSGAGGGGIRAGDGDPRILDNVIEFNSGADYGGGIVLNYCGATVRNNLIYRNSGGAAYGGGGLWLNGNGAQPKLIENNTIVGNSSGSSGGGICFLGGASATVRNVIIWGNSTPQMTAGHTASYCDIQGGWSGTGNIDAEPLFADGNYFLLSASSPCVDAGDTSVALDDPADGAHPGQALWPARGALRSDIGAYGGPGSALLPRSPTLASFASPAQGQAKVDLLAPLTVAFSAPADTASVAWSFSDPAITLAPQWNARRDTLTLGHGQPFADLGWYALCIQSARDSAGLMMALLPDSAVFRATDTVRPRLVSTYPADGATGIALTARPRLKFSKPVNRASLQYLFSDTSYHFVASWASGDTQVQLYHNSKPFAAGVTYTLALSAVTDTFGNALVGSDVPDPFSFTAAAAGVEGSPAAPNPKFRLEPVSPNPAGRSGRISFRFSLPNAGEARLAIYNALGQQVMVLADSPLPAGQQSLQWDIAGQRNGPVSSGLYFARLSAGPHQVLARFIIAK